MGRSISNDQEILELCVRAIAAEGEEFEAAMADFREAIRQNKPPQQAKEQQPAE